LRSCWKRWKKPYPKEVNTGTIKLVQSEHLPVPYNRQFMTECGGDQVSQLQEQRDQLTAAELAAATLQADLVVAALRQSRDLRE
jgi:hypothetical protein